MEKKDELHANEVVIPKTEEVERTSQPVDWEDLTPKQSVDKNPFLKEFATVEEKQEVIVGEQALLKEQYEKLRQDHEQLKEQIASRHTDSPTAEQYEAMQKQYDTLQEKYDALVKRQETMVSQEQYKEVIDKMLAILNTIDQIAGAYRNTGENQLVAEQLEKVANIALAQLKDLQLEEIPVYGKEIDGEYMESFGVAQHVSDEKLQPHQVAIVMRRAFKHSETGEIVQSALVYTVPEEE